MSSQNTFSGLLEDRGHEKTAGTLVQLADSFGLGREDFQSQAESNIENRSNLSRGFVSGIDSTQAMLGGAAGLLGDAVGNDTLRDWGFNTYQDNMHEASLNPLDVQNFTDIDNLSDASKWFMGTIGQLAPSMGQAAISAIVGGGVTGIAARKLAIDSIEKAVSDRVSQGVAREIAEDQVKKRLGDIAFKKGYKTGGAAGLQQGVAALEGGGMWGEDAEIHGVENANAGSAFALGNVSGASELVSPGGQLIQRITGIKGLSRTSDKVADTFLKRIGTEIPKAMGGEASQEIFQSFLGVLNKKVNDPTVALADREAINEYINSGAAGAAGGVLFGGAKATFPGEIRQQEHYTVDDVLDDSAAQDAVESAVVRETASTVDGVLNNRPLTEYDAQEEESLRYNRFRNTRDERRSYFKQDMGVSSPAGVDQMRYDIYDPNVPGSAQDAENLRPQIREMVDEIFPKPDSEDAGELPKWAKLRTLKDWEKETGDPVREYVNSTSAKATLKSVVEGKPLTAKQEKIWNYLRAVAESKAAEQQEEARNRIVASGIPLYDPEVHGLGAHSPFAPGNEDPLETGDLLEITDHDSFMDVSDKHGYAAARAVEYAAEKGVALSSQEAIKEGKQYDTFLQEVMGDARKQGVKAQDVSTDATSFSAYDKWKENKGKAEPLAEPTTEKYEVVNNTDSVAHGQEVNTNPTEKQKEAENYKMAHVKVDGLDISIENPAGSTRKGKSPDGKEWESEMKNDYGRFKGTTGFDKDHVDVFISNGYQGGAKYVYIVNQHNKDGSFDEHKVVLGANSSEEALSTYNQNYEAGWDGGKSVTQMSLMGFKGWVKSEKPGKGPVKNLTTVEAHSLQPKTVDNQNSESNTDNLNIIEHTTKRGKTLRGIVRTDLTKAEAQEIDKYTFKKGGGYFIREKHLGGTNDSVQSVQPVEGDLPDTKAGTQVNDTRSNESTAQEASQEVDTEVVSKGGDLISPETKQVKNGEVNTPPTEGKIYRQGRPNGKWWSFSKDYAETFGKSGKSKQVHESSIPKGVKLIDESDLIPLLNESEKRDRGFAGYEEAIKRLGYDGFTRVEEDSSGNDSWSVYLVNPPDLKSVTPVKYNDPKEEVPETSEPIPSQDDQPVQSDTDKDRGVQSPVQEKEEVDKGVEEKDSSKEQFASNKIFTSDAVAAARARLKEKRSTLSSGFDPELLQDMLILGGAYFESGARKFADWSKAILDDVGQEFNPFLRGTYENLRHYPGLETDGMNSQEFVEEYLKGEDVAKVKPKVKEEEKTTPDVSTQDTGGEGETSSSDSSIDKKTVTKLNRLRETARKLNESAEEKLNQDRLTNTPKRVREAGYAIEAANKDIQIAKTILKIADAIEAGELKELSKVTAKTHIVLINSILNQAKYKADRDKPYSDKDRHRPPKESDIKFATYPYPSLHKEWIDSMIRDLEKIKGAKGLIKKLLNMRRLAIDSPAILSQESHIDTLRDAVKKLGKDASQWIKDSIKEYDQIKRIGIDGPLALEKALHEYLYLLEDKAEIDPIKKMEMDLVGQNTGVDFFPTPKEKTPEIVERADIKPGMKTLEPSAGTGNLADQMKEAGAEVDVVELSSKHRDILEAKGYNVVGHDFMNLKEGDYDRIVMNPPFSKNMDVQHVRHAYSLLKPGGKLVSIMGEGAFFRQGKEETAFRNWLEDVGYSEKLPEKFFMDKRELRTTSVNARVIEIEKPDSKSQEKPKKEHYATAKEHLKAIELWRKETGNRNVYEQKQEDRADRIEERAQRLSDESTAAYNRANKIGERFYMGQPILVDHHSGPKAKRDQERMHSAMDKSVALDKKARHATSKAAATRSNKAISSDDEDAVVKLRVKIERAEEKQAFMKAVNQAIRKKDTAKGDAELETMGITPERIALIREPDFAGRVGFPGYELTNNNANIRRMKDRLATLERNRQDESSEIDFDGGTIFDNVEDNRVQIDFDLRPGKEMRAKLKGRGFKWAPSVRMWQKKRSYNALYAAKSILGVSDEKKGASVVLAEDGRAYILEDLAEKLFRAGQKFADFVESVRGAIGDAIKGVMDKLWTLYEKLNNHLDSFTSGAQAGNIRVIKGEEEFDPEIQSEPDTLFSSENIQETIESTKGSYTFVKNKKTDSTFLDRVFSTPEYYFKKVGAAGRVLQAALLRRDVKFENEQRILGGFVDFIQKLRKTNKKAYEEASDYLITLDQEADGFRIKASEDDDSWTVKAPLWAVGGDKSKQVIGIFADEQEAVDEMIKAEAAHLQTEGYSDKAVEAVVRARELTNRGFDVMAADMRKIIEEAREAGLPDPFIGDGKVDEAGRYGVYAKGKSKPIALFPTQQEAEEMLENAAEMLSYALYDKKGNKVRNFKSQLKAKQWAAKRSGYTVKGEKVFSNLTVRKRTNAEMRPLTVKQALAQMGDLRGIYFPRIREAGEYILIAEKDGENPIRKHYDIPAADLKGKTAKIADVINMATPAGREVRRLKALGYNVRMEKDTSPSEDVFEATNLITSVDALLQGTLGTIDKNSEADVKAGQHINQILTMQIADIFKSRGYLSSRIKRLAGDVVWEGYEKDIGKALTQYGKNVAAGTAKRDTARAMALAFTGRDYSWQEYKKEVENPQWEEYIEIVEKRRIDEGKQKNLFRDVRSFMIDVLRNDEQADRIIGTIKGLAVLKYLGFRVSSAAVNMTNMVQGVPATISGHTGEDIHKVLGQVAASATAYVKFRSSKGNISDEDRKIFEYISAKGWDEAQFNHEAARELRGKAGNFFNKYVSIPSMYMFGAAEKANRAMTLHAAYKTVRKKEKTADDSYVWEKAKEISDRSHGVYGKETLPSWARGKYNILKLTYTFQKFAHSYMLNMIDLGFKKREFKAAAYMLLSPAILAGSSASLLAPALTGLVSIAGIGGDDPEEGFYQWAEDAFGGGDYARHGVFGGVLGINIKGSLQMHNPMPTSLAELAGPAGGIAQDYRRGFEHLAKGEVVKGAEAFLPTGIGSLLKSPREYFEGVTTNNYGTVHYGNEPLKADLLDATLRFFSFNPSRLSGIREKQWHEKKVKARYQDEKTDIYAEIKRSYLKGGGLTPEIFKAIHKYNERVRDSGRPDIKPITAESINLMLKLNRKSSKLERARAI